MVYLHMKCKRPRLVMPYYLEVLTFGYSTLFSMEIFQKTAFSSGMTDLLLIK